MKKNSVLYKYFITYTAIILAVCLSASFLFFFVASSQYSENVDASNVNRLNASKQALDSDFSECLSIANKLLSNNVGYAQDVHFKELNTPIEFKSALHEYLVGNSDFLDIIMIPDMSINLQQSYYSATGGVDYEYFDRYYGFEKITHQWIVENIASISAPMLVQTNTNGTWGYKHPVNILIIPEELFVTNHKFDAVMFVYNSDTIVNQLTSSFEDSTANAMIVSTDGELLMADDEIFEEPERFMQKIPAHKKKYTKKSSTFEWTYSLFVDESVFGGYVGTTGFIVLLCISLFLILTGILAAFIAARHSYKPFRELMSIFPKEFTDEENEFSIMHRIFTEMNRKNEMLMENIEELKDKKRTPLADLLAGNKNKTDSAALAMELGLPVNAGAYVLGILEVDDYDKFRKFKGGIPASDLVCKGVMESIKMPSFAGSLPGYGFYVVIIAIHKADESEREKLKHMMRNAQDRIKNVLDVSVTCTLSRCFYRVEDASEIIYSVICATGYRVIYGYDSIIDMDLMDKQYVNIDTEFFNCFFEFYSNLKNGDYNSVIENLMQMKNTIKNSFSPDVFRLAYINIIHCFAQYISDEEIKSELTVIPKTVDGAFDNILELTDKFFEAEGNNSKLKNEILRLVNSEYTNSELSINYVAERLDISNSYLRKYFKETMGVTLFAYIDEMRISHAKKLLFETSMPIREVAKASGYNDINNFNRKFKLKTGKTPSSYRANKSFAEEQ